MSNLKPFLKWAGGKRRVLPKIIRKLPGGDRLVEPFVGAGAVFAGTNYDRYLIADDNFDVINVFKQLKEHGDDFIRLSKEFFAGHLNNDWDYYRHRDIFNRLSKLGNDGHYRRALFFIYLNRHGFNGLCRYNKAGDYNVPFGKYKSVYFPEDEMRGFAEKLHMADIRHGDFRTTMIQAEPGDVVYCDPPYSPIDQETNFTEYSGSSFTDKDHQDLLKFAVRRKELGIPVVISNHSTKFTRDLYHGGCVNYFKVGRSIAANGGNRRRVVELLVRFGGKS